MSNEIIEGLFLIGAAIAGGVISSFSSWLGAHNTRLKEKNIRLRQQAEALLKQIEAYHLLEDIYAKDIAEQNGAKAVKTVKTEYRNKVVENHQCSRPEMTANEAKIRLQGLV